MIRRNLLLAVIISLASLQIGNATYAWYTDSATSINNTFTTAKINISANRDRGDPFPGPLFYFDNHTDGATTDGLNIPGVREDGYWYPGAISKIKTLQINNLSNSIPIKLYKIDAVVVDPTPNDGVDDSVLKNALKITISHDDDYGTSILWAGYLSELTDGTPDDFSNLINMGVSSTDFLKFQASWPSSDNDNQYQGKNVKVQFRVYVTQQKAVGIL